MSNGVFYRLRSSGSSATVTAADDGVSLLGTTVQLGQAVGAAGNPAAITEDREIPDNGHTVWVGSEAAGVNVIGLSATQGLDVTNTLGQIIQALMFGTNFTLFAFSADFLQLVWGSGANALSITFQVSTQRVTIGGSMIATEGIGANLRSPATSPTLTFLPGSTSVVGDTTLIVDTSGGNCNINIDPTKLTNQFGWIKKKGSDVNTITMTALSGLIYSDGTSASTFSFNDAGETIQFQSDGTNLYIL